MTASELVVKYVFKADTTKLNDLIKGVGELNLSSVLAGLGLGTLATTAGVLAEQIGKIMKQGEGTAVWMKNFTAQTGLSAQEMKKWKNMAEEMGVSAESIVGAIMNIREAQRRWLTDPSMRKAFAQLGYHTGIVRTDTPFAMLGKIASAIKKDPRNKDIIIEEAKALGITLDLARLLEMTDQERLATLSRMEALTREQADNLDKSHKASVRLGNAFKNISDTLASAMAPAFEEWQNGIANFLENTYKGKSGAMDNARILANKTLAYGGMLSAMSMPIVGMTSQMNANVQAGAKAGNKNYQPTFIINGPMETIIAKIDELMKKMISEAEYQKQVQ